MDDYAIGFQEGRSNAENDADECDWQYLNNLDRPINDYEQGYIDGYNSVLTVECPSCKYGCSEKRMVSHKITGEEVCEECSIAKQEDSFMEKYVY